MSGQQIVLLSRDSEDTGNTCYMAIGMGWEIRSVRFFKAIDWPTYVSVLFHANLEV